MFRRLLILALLALGLPLPASAAAPPQVVVSVKPLHSLVAGIMRGVGEPYLLVRGAASPHAFALRPSDARALAGAQLVVWTGPALETFLGKPLTTLVTGAEVMTVMGLPGLTLLPTRRGGAWDHGQGHDHGPGTTDNLGTDGHVWLDPRNAVRISDAVADALARLDPDHAATYRANAASQRDMLSRLDTEMMVALEPLRSRPFITFHDAYHYLEDRYGLHAVGTITVTPDQPPGAARLTELRRRVKEAGAVCVFAEPQFEPALVRTLAEGTGARTGVLDPEGANIPDGPDLYPALLRFNLRSLVDCLSGG